MIPNNENIAAGGKKLPFTIRAILEPTSTASNGREFDALGFVSPDCRLNTNPLTAGTMLGGLIPDILWLPFGTGVALSLGRRCQMHRADITRTDDGEECRIDGSLTAFATAEMILHEKKRGIS